MTLRLQLALILASTSLGLAACVASPSDAQGQAKADAKNAAEAKTEPEAKSATGPAFIAAGEGPVEELVEAARATTEPAGQQLVVYVGAHWCEPCQYFHDAVEAGSLDQAFPTLRLLEFDLDHDRDRLAKAGYSSRMIPLFVVPGPEGLAGPRRMEGGIKGPGAVDNISGRLGALLEAAAADARSRQ